MFAILLFIIGALGLETYPLGINFGRSYIAAAHIVAPNNPIIVATIVGNEDYLAYQADVLHNLKKGVGGHNDSKVRDIFARTISEIRVAATTALNRHVDIAAIALPQHFNGSSRQCAAEAAETAEPRIVLGNQMRYFLNSAMAAYRLNTCEGLGYGQSKCDLEDVHMGIFLNYDPEYIEMYVTDLSDHGVFVNAHLKLDFKDNFLSKKASPPDGWFEPNYKKIGAAFKEFLKGHFTPESQDLIEDISGIVISGETSPEGGFTVSQDKLRKMLTELFPSKVDKIKDSIDPQFVGAVGAAYWARRFTEQPFLLVEDNNGYYPGAGHDEL